MLLSPTLPYSWSFPWQITEQQFHPVGLTLEKLGLLPKRAGPLFSFSLVFFFFLFPTQVYSNSFFCSNLFSSSGPDAVAEVPLAWCCSGLPVLICISSASGSTGPSLPTGLSRFVSGAAPPQQSAVCPLLKPTARRWFAICPFSIFSPQILNTLTLTEKAHTEALPFWLAQQPMQNMPVIKIAFSYGKWAPQWASQTHSPLCELSLSAAQWW